MVLLPAIMKTCRGVVNVIRYQSAQAVTAGGIHCDMYVNNDAALDGLEGGKSVQVISRRRRWMQIGGLSAIITRWARVAV